VERAEKREFVASFGEVLKNTGVVVVAHYAGLSVAQMTAYAVVKYVKPAVL
jgi:large subunit ribosomal protein L10